MENYTLKKIAPSYKLSQNDSFSLKAELALIPGSPYADFEPFAYAAFEVIRRLIAKELFNKILDLRRNIYNEGLLVIENSPVDEHLIPTPLLREWKDVKQSYISEAMLLGIGQLLGEIYGYRGEKKGALIHNNYPTNSGAGSISNEGSMFVLPMHNEDIHVFPYSPSFLMLSCLREGMGSEVFTYILNIKDVIGELDEYELSVLRSKQFYIESPESFETNSPSSALIPILSGPSETPQVTVEFTDTKGTSRDARRVLQKFKEVCLASPSLKKLKLKNGDILILDNRKTLHGRSNFEANFDGTDRWCQRIFIKSGDLWDWRGKFTKERVLEF
ncbi:MAG: TauD/TfdA family dioxygenase [Bacteroidota bacterium]